MMQRGDEPMAEVNDHDESLTASYRLKYAYKRSLGPVLSAFFTQLRNRKIMGIRNSDVGQSSAIRSSLCNWM